MCFLTGFRFYSECVTFKYRYTNTHTCAHTYTHTPVIARSPVFTHVNASMLGLTTIRALAKQTTLVREFHTYQVCSIYVSGIGYGVSVWGMGSVCGVCSQCVGYVVSVWGMGSVYGVCYKPWVVVVKQHYYQSPFLLL